MSKKYARQCSLYSSLIHKHIIDIRGMSVFECAGDFLDLCIYIGEDLNIMNISKERKPNY